MIVTTTALFRHAYGKYALGAYNINNLEQTVGLFRGNLGKTKKNEDPVNPAVSAPFIIQISRGARGYTDKRFLEAMIRTAEQVFPEAIFAVHLDHGTEEACYDSIDSGFYSSVMIDASHEPFEKNIAITRQVVERAHAKGVVVEAELGQLGGVEEDVTGSVCLTDAAQAAEFIAKSGCDSLAVAIGTSHGAYKFAGSQGLRMDRLAEIQKSSPKGYPLVMHGSSSVPKAWVDRINAAGGKMKNASGVPEDQYLPAAKLGVCKVNIDTDGRLVWCAVYRETFRDKPEDFDPRTPGKPFMAAYAEYIIHKNQKLGSAGQLESVCQSLGADEAVAGDNRGRGQWERCAVRPEDVREFLERRPFRPFRITLTDGRTYTVGHPESALVGRSAVKIGLRGVLETGPGVDRLVTISLLHIMEIEIQQPTGNS